MLFDVFQQYPAAMPILATVGGLIIGSFLNVVIWRYPIMLRQQMA
ncbi:TPA: prepilin peptidase, partial [Escherichia coli]|nr:prepilin peptidase [Escherichia coli]